MQKGKFTIKLFTIGLWEALRSYFVHKAISSPGPRSRFTSHLRDARRFFDMENPYHAEREEGSDVGGSLTCLSPLLWRISVVDFMGFFANL